MSAPAPDSKRSRISVKDMAFIAMFSALIAVCSMISIPIGEVPVTLQTFGVCLAAAMLGKKRGPLSVLIYILIGAIGIPVFAGLKGGFGVLAGPTGGYIVGFLPAALIIGFSAEKWERKTLPMTLSMALGVLLCYTVGTIWFMVVTKMHLGESLLLCVVPFLIPDGVKIAVAVILSHTLSKAVKL